jgi:transcriptional regulator with XRE-family HTH domain
MNICKRCNGAGQLPDAAELRAQRLAASKPLSAIAKAANTSVGRIHNIESGYRPVTAKIAAAYAQALANARSI